MEWSAANVSHVGMDKNIYIHLFAIPVLMCVLMKHFKSYYCVHIVIESEEERELLIKLRSSNEALFSKLAWE